MSTQKQLHINKRVDGVEPYYPAQDPPIGTPFSAVFPQNKCVPALFKPLKLRGVEFKNRIFVSPMCQYSSDDGHATDWHLVHIGQFAIGGAGAIIMEATAVVPEGRISPEDAGLWTDSQIAPLKRIVDFAHAQGAQIGVQLGHAGRKSSTYAPWVAYTPGKPRPAGQTAAADENGWPEQVNGPSAIPWSHRYATPHEMTLKEIKDLEDAFVASIERSVKVGYDFIEIHAAHGYLLHQFYSPLSNTRTDQYGGSLENRARLTLDIVRRAREVWPADKPLFVRISADDWTGEPEKAADGTWASWGIEQSKWLVKQFAELKVDLVDVSSGGNWHDSKFNVTDGYQTHWARAIKEAVPEIVVGTVGMIHSPEQAEGYVAEGYADVVLMAREFLRRPNWPLHAAQKLGAAVHPPVQYERAWTGLMTPHYDAVVS
ncbi:NADH:flavin oxidoreductase/NADH oxidase [Exidia glandulosa HHB12029]|uniref:NADH:flavin oxidoreductase/NADH oxidase n=1 Tax=Exidia glandulosa HHB12029 TaxID=1314781 RepID=A0A165Q404_EXIGL|nr:NADH:flavin oxidoreductase/NADH oxidase [Exidia glandulosa HHB12029]